MDQQTVVDVRQQLQRFTRNVSDQVFELECQCGVETADVVSGLSLCHDQKVCDASFVQTSSRSHTIVRLQLETVEAGSKESKGTTLVKFVDLAGSERISKTGTTGLRFTVSGLDAVQGSLSETSCGAQNTLFVCMASFR